MPCSGLKSATSLTSFAANSRSIAVAPSRARPVWLVTSPTRLPLSGAKPCARSTSRPVWTGGVRVAGRRGARGAEVAPGHQARARPASAGASVIADAAIVATRARSGVTSPRPSGCTRFDMKTTNALRQRIDPERRAGEAGVAERADRQQLAAVGRERRVDVPAQAAHVRIARSRSPASSSSRPSAARGCARRCSGRRSAACAQKIDRSAAVLNSPAWPATPAIRRAVGSCTTPRSICMSGPVARPAVRRALLGRRDPRPQRRRPA